MAREANDLKQGNGVKGPDGQLPGSGDASGGENRKILMVGQEPAFSEAMADYAVNLAERLGYDLIAVNVAPEPDQRGIYLSPYRRYVQQKFSRAAKAGAAHLAEKARRQGVAFEHLVRFGKPGQVVADLHHSTKRIEFVLNASEMKEAALTGGITLPVFTITGDQGEAIMAQPQKHHKMNLAAKTAAWGLGAAAVYAAVFMNSTTITAVFAQGGWYAALPLATVFLVSFVHGTFSHHLWELLGIQAPTTAQPRPTAAKRPAARKRPRPRLRLNV